MTTFDARGGVSIAQLIVFFPSLFLAGYLCSRHGFNRSSGWVFLLIFSLIRIAGACCQLATYSDSSEGLYTAALVLDSIGISPLLFATLNILGRFVDWANREIAYPTFRALHFRIIQLLILAGVILNIVGASGGITLNANGTYTPPQESMAGVILYVVVFVINCLILLLSMRRIGSVPYKERRVIPAVGLALPILAVRLVYSVCLVFVANNTFNFIDGNVAVWVCMAVVEEFIVLIIYLTLGFSLDVQAADELGPIQTRGRKNPGARREGISRGDGVGLVTNLETPPRYDPLN